jgi:hypothetical protein
MATFDYSGLVATARRLIEKFGRTATLRRKAKSGTAWDPTISTTDYTIKIVVIDDKMAEARGTLVTIPGKTVYVSTEGLSVVPAVADQLVIDGTTYAIQRVLALNPGGTTLLYEI